MGDHSPNPVAKHRIDSAWLQAHPLPLHDDDTDKNSRGRVLLVGGAEFVPGALQLTGEASLRAGAGKLQMATIGAAAMPLGVLVPEAAMVALPAGEDGEIAPQAAEILENLIARCDTLVLGPGMSENEQTNVLLRRLLKLIRPQGSLVLDAAALTSAAPLHLEIAALQGRVIMTPHHGEMAALAGVALDDVRANCAEFALTIARRFNAITVLKAAQTVIAAPDSTLLQYESHCPGLATGGSGDVLAGIAGALLARGAPPLAAAGWAVALHGAAGRKAAEDIGPIGFLARDLLIAIPRLMADWQ